MGTSVQADEKLRQVVVSAVVVRADGTREELGTVAYWHRNPLRRAWFALKSQWSKLRGGNK